MRLRARTCWGDHEVEEGDLGGHLGEVVGVPQLGGDVEPERVAVPALQQNTAKHSQGGSEIR